MRIGGWWMVVYEDRWMVVYEDRWMVDGGI